MFSWYRLAYTYQSLTPEQLFQNIITITQIIMRWSKRHCFSESFNGLLKREQHDVRTTYAHN